MKKPIIGITGSIMKDPAFEHHRRSFVNDDYIRGVIKNGGVPYIIPINTDEEVIRQQVSMLDGLILSGGVDINPLRYNQEPLVKLRDISDERDLFDLKVLEIALEKDIPIFGICRGLQIINVYFGGTLYQDLSYNEKFTIKHDQVVNPLEKMHSIIVEKDTKLEEIMGETEWVVNSFHHQAIDQLGRNLKPVAHSKDGIIEAVEGTENKYLLAVQFHPEMIFEHDDKMSQLFKRFVEEAR